LQLSQFMPLKLISRLQAIISHCHASHKPLVKLRLASRLQTILHHASAHGLLLWLHGIQLPLCISSARPPTPDAAALPCWYAAAVAVMDDDTVKQVLVAAAAAAAAAAASLVTRSDAALTAPCATSAVQWCVIAIAAHSLARRVVSTSAFAPYKVRCGALSMARGGAGVLGK
jgi:hypothetical protein